MEINGKASHAGVHPEQGISATLVAALALSEVRAGGWFGKVRQGEREGTSNVGVFGGHDGKSAGDATNVVTDYVYIRGESRSHDPKFFKEITKAYAAAFKNAATKVLDDEGHKAKGEIHVAAGLLSISLEGNGAGGQACRGGGGFTGHGAETASRQRRA